jgi:hypothetical protein
MVGQVTGEGTYQLDHLTEAYATSRTSTARSTAARIGTWSRVMSRASRGDCGGAQSGHLAHCSGTWSRPLHQHRGRPCARGRLGPCRSLSTEQAQRGNTGARFVKPDTKAHSGRDDRQLHLASLGFLKLDVEGSEPAALRGAKDTLARCRPVVLENKFLWSRHYACRRTPCRGAHGAAVPDGGEGVATRSGRTDEGPHCRQWEGLVADARRASAPA